MFHFRYAFGLILFTVLTFAGGPARADFVWIENWGYGPFAGGGFNGTGLAAFGDVTADTGFAKVYAMQGVTTQTNPQSSGGGVDFERKFTIDRPTVVELDGSLLGHTALDILGGGVGGVRYTARATIYRLNAPFETGISVSFAGTENDGDVATTQTSSGLLDAGTYLVGAKFSNHASTHGNLIATSDFYNGANGFAVSVIPEPGSFAMLAIGTTGLALMRCLGIARRRRLAG